MMPENTKQKPGYKKTALGWIPEEWDAVKGNSIFAKRTTKGTSGLPVLSVTIDSGIVRRDSLERRLLAEVEAEGSLLVEKDDLAYNMMRMWQGAVGIALYPGVISPAYIVLRCKKGSDPKFFFYHFKSYRCICLLERFSYGVAADRLRLYFDDLCLIPFPLPPLPEQRAIAGALGCWDKAIGTLSALIAQKQARKKWLMQLLLTGKRRLPGFSDGSENGKGAWRPVRLGDICQLVNGMAFKPEDWKTEGVPIIRIQNLNGSTDYNYFQGKIQKRNLVNHGDVLFAWSGSRGTSFGSFKWRGPQAVLNQHIFNVLPDHRVNKDFLYHLLRWLTIDIERRAHGSAGLVHVTKKQLENESAIIPNDVAEQISIVEILELAESEIELLKRKYEQINAQKKGLMQELLTGRKRINKITT